MKNRYLLATDTFDNKVFSVCLFDAENSKFIKSENIVGEKEFKKRVKQLSEYYNTSPIEEFELKEKPKSRVYTNIPRMSEAIVDFYKTDKGKEQLLKYLKEEDAIDLDLVEELVNFGKN